MQQLLEGPIEERLDEHRPLYQSSFIDILFGPTYELLPHVSQRYEIDVAYGETQSLSDDELLHRSAYLYKVDGRVTHHYHICQHRPVQVDPDLKHRQNFFDANAYGVGYATDGLFPYRGKFHPQMIKGTMNIIGLKPGDTRPRPDGRLRNNADRGKHYRHQQHRRLVTPERHPDA